MTAETQPGGELRICHREAVLGRGDPSSVIARPYSAVAISAVGAGIVSAEYRLAMTDLLLALPTSSVDAAMPRLTLQPSLSAGVPRLRRSRHDGKGTVAPLRACCGRCADKFL